MTRILLPIQMLLIAVWPKWSLCHTTSVSGSKSSPLGDYHFVLSVLQNLFGFGNDKDSFLMSKYTATSSGIPCVRLERILDFITGSSVSPYKISSYCDFRRRRRILKRKGILKKTISSLHGVVNFAIVKDWRRAVTDFAHTLITAGHLELSRILQDGCLIIDLFVDAKSTGMAALSGHCLIFALHFVQAARAQELTTMLPVAVQLGSDGSEALRRRLYSSSRIMQRLNRLRRTRLRLPCGTFLPLQVNLTCDFKEIGLQCDVSKANTPFPREPDADDAANGCVPTTQWFQGQQSPWCSASPVDMYRLRPHPALDAPHEGFSAYLGFSPENIFMGPFHGLYNVHTQFMATLCRWLHRGPLQLSMDHPTVLYLQNLYRPIGSDDMTQDRDYMWDPLRMLSAAEREKMRVSSLHKALPTLVLRMCQSGRFYANLSQHLKKIAAEFFPHAVVLRSIRIALLKLQQLYRAYKCLPGCAFGELAGHEVWGVWMQLVKDLSPPTDFPPHWGVEMDPRGSAAGPSSCFFLTTSATFLRRRGAYAAAAWEVVGENYLKRAMNTFNMGKIGMCRHHRRPLLFMRLLIPYQVADAETPPNAAACRVRGMRRRMNTCLAYEAA